MNNINVLIVGCGVVGTNLSKEISTINPDMYDKYLPQYQSKIKGVYDVIFICVDTPMTSDDVNDIAAINAVIHEQKIHLKPQGVMVIKSTLLPSKFESIVNANHDIRFVVSPEYYGATKHSSNSDNVFDFTILGGYESDCIKVQQVLQKCYKADHRFIITDSTTAILAKYMENSWIATKVSFCNQFYRIAEQLGVSYEKLRELFIMDPRVNPSHTFVFRDKPYWDSHCLNKDVPSIASLEGTEFLKGVIEYNNLCKTK